MFSIIRTEHQNCLECEAQAHPAAAMCRATGAAVSSYSDGSHGARVQRRKILNNVPLARG